MSQGPNEKAARKTILDLKDGIDPLPREFGAYAAAAITLAQTLDAGAGLATATVAREYRALVDALRDCTAPLRRTEEEDLDADLSSPVGDAADA